MEEPGGPQSVCPKAAHPSCDGRERSGDFGLWWDSADSEPKGVTWAGLYLHPKLTLTLLGDLYRHVGEDSWGGGDLVSLPPPCPR